MPRRYKSSRPQTGNRQRSFARVRSSIPPSAKCWRAMASQPPKRCSSATSLTGGKPRLIPLRDRGTADSIEIARQNFLCRVCEEELRIRSRRSASAMTIHHLVHHGHRKIGLHAHLGERWSAGRQYVAEPALDKGDGRTPAAGIHHEDIAQNPGNRLLRPAFVAATGVAANAWWA
jgi:hypothetical protein